MDEIVNSADRPAFCDEKIEVTPEMIAAGVEEFGSFREWDVPWEVVRAVYVAMEKAKAPCFPRQGSG